MAMSRRAAAAVAVLALAALAVRAADHVHSHGGEPCDHDHGHDTRSMYHRPDPEAEKAEASGGDSHSHGHDHGHHDHDHGAAAKDAAAGGGGHDGHDHGHGSGGGGHVHEHGDGCGHDHAMLEAPPVARDLMEEVDKLIKTFLTEPKSILWFKALSATGIICCAPVVMLFIIPLRDAESSKPLLNVLLSFAAGGLLGDALLHLIPHALNPHDHAGGGHDHGHSHGHDHGHGGGGGGHDHGSEMRVGLWVLGGILAFMVVEKLVRNIKGGSGHGHSHGAPAEQPKAAAGGKDKKATGADDKPVVKGSDIKVAGYLNLAADFAHNFTDGLTLGAVFLHPEASPWMTFVAILLHEVPHEIGDFAILMQSGCTKWQAIRLQLTTAIGAMMGTVVGLMSENMGKENSVWILPFTAGGFIYIATVSVIPELLEDSGLVQSICEVLAFVAGVGTMVFIMFFE